MKALDRAVPRSSAEQARPAYERWPPSRGWWRSGPERLPWREVPRVGLATDVEREGVGFGGGSAARTATILCIDAD